MLVALPEEDPPTLHHLVVAGAVAAVAGVVDCVVVAADALAFDTFSGVADAAVVAAGAAVVDCVVVAAAALAFDAFAGVADAAVVVGFLAVAAAVVSLVDSQNHSEEDPLKQLRFHSLFFSFPPLHCRQWLGRSALP